MTARAPLRFSLSGLAIGYIALGLLALALFAVPLWYSWQVNVSTFRAYVQADEMQRVIDAFHRDGANGAAAAIDAMAASLPRDRVMMFADASKLRLAGNLREWPVAVPDAPGTYGLVIGLGGDSSMRVVASHVTLPGGYHLLIGRESVRFESLVERFWYGIAAAMAVILVLGAVIAWLSRRALVAALGRYAAVLEASEEGFWDWTVATDHFYASPRLLEICGFPPDTRFASHAEFLERFPFHPEDRAKWQQAASAHFAGKSGRFDTEIRMLRNGETRWLHLTGLATRDGSGAVVRWTGATRDVTARRSAEEALRLSEERYSLAMEAAQDAHWDWIIGTDEYYSSPRGLQLYGLPAGMTFASREDFLARSPLLPEDRQAWRRAVAELFAGTGSHLSMELRAHVHGETRWIQFNGVCLRDASGKPLRWSGSSRDVTDRKRAEEALRFSEERYARALEASDDGIWEWNPVTDQAFASPRARHLFGIPEGVEIRTREDLKAHGGFHPEDQQRIDDSIKASLGRGDGGFDIEYRVIDPAGEVRWVHSRGKVFGAAAGEPALLTGSLTDITERKRSEQAQRHSEERYARAMEGSDAGHWDWNTVTDEMFVSQRATEMLGLDARTLPAKRAQIMALVRMHPDDRQSMDEIARASLALGVHERDYRVITPSGDLRWLRSRAKVFLGESGAPERMTGSLSDITEGKLAEEALRLSQERYALAMDASEEGHFDWNVATDEIFVSVHIRKVLDLPRDAEYRTRADLIAHVRYHGTDRPRLEEMTRSVLAGTALEHEFEYRILRGEEVRWMRARWKIFRDPAGAALRVIGVVTDITERKLAAEALRSRQEMLELAQKSARAIAFEWRIGDGDGENRWSADLEAMYGLAPGTYDGSYEAWKKLVHPDDWPAVEEAIKHAHRTGDVASEYRVMHADRSVHWLQARGRMFFDGRGKPIRMVGFMQDVTQRRYAEDELRRMERQLRQAQRLEAVGTLAGGIAHDFNNILAAILGYGHMALRDAPMGSRMRRDMESILTAGERGRALVERILAFSRSGVGERVAVHVEAVVREALELLSASLPHHVRIEPQLRAGRAAMLGDATQVHQVLMNIATNGIQAIGSSGGVLRVSLEALTLAAPQLATTGPVAAGDWIILKITDSGSGIAPDILEKIFDPFFTTKDVGVGTGLGLSLVHGIVAELGGAVDVESVPGAGSTFTVYFPRAGDAIDAAAVAPPDAPRGDRQRILVVDDEEPLVMLATRTLEELGYESVGFTSSAAALAAFRVHPERFDAVLTDERMPGMSGATLIREVRGIRRAIPILLISGYLGKGVASRAYNAGADEVLKKPLSPRELASSLARVLHA